MISILTLLFACTDGSGPSGDVVLADCYRTNLGREFAFTVSGTAPYEWGIENQTVDPTGLVVTNHPPDTRTVTFQDGTVHVVAKNRGQLYDGEQSLYRAIGPTLERTDDLGATWAPVNSPIVPTIDQLGTNVAVRGSWVFEWEVGESTTNGMQVSNDRGLSWRVVRYPEVVATPTRITGATIDANGRIFVVRSNARATGIGSVMYSDDEGANWTTIADDLQSGTVQVGDDGTAWWATLDGLFWSTDLRTVQGGPVETEFDTFGDQLGVGHLQPMSGGRMGFVSNLSVHSYCVVGPDTTGAVVPDPDAVPPTPPSTETDYPVGEVTLAADLPADVDFALVDGRLAQAEINVSFDALPKPLYYDGTLILDPGQNTPPGSETGMVITGMTTNATNDNIALAMQPTQFSELGTVSGEVWEVTKSGEVVGIWTLALGEGGVQHQPRRPYPGPFNTMIVATTGGYYDANQSLLTLVDTEGEVAVDPLSGDVYYLDGDWLARSTGNVAGVFGGRCADATESSQDCYSVAGLSVAGVKIGHDRYIYVYEGSQVVRRPLYYPDQDWELVMDGFGVSGRWEIDRDAERRTRVWVKDGGPLYVGVIGDTLPLVR